MHACAHVRFFPTVSDSRLAHNAPRPPRPPQRSAIAGRRGIQSSRNPSSRTTGAAPTVARGPPAIEALFDGGFDAPQDPAPRRRGTPGVKAHDYIVVGAGSAGCVLANRLSESGRHSVLLLEAGPRDTNPWIHIPLGYGKLFTNARVNWAYESEPEPALEGFSNSFVFYIYTFILYEM